MGWSPRYFDSLRQEKAAWVREMRAGSVRDIDEALDRMNAIDLMCKIFEGPDGYNEPDKTL